jgi:hypothetical protein
MSFYFIGLDRIPTGVWGLAGQGDNARSDRNHGYDDQEPVASFRGNEAERLA